MKENLELSRWLGIFGLEVISLISNGKKEYCKDVEAHISDGDLVEYIFGKYQENFLNKFDGRVYDNEVLNEYFNEVLNEYFNEALNEYFKNYDGCTQGDDKKRFRIVKEEDGLLLVLALIVDNKA